MNSTLTASLLDDGVWRRFVLALGRWHSVGGPQSDLVEWAVSALEAGWDSPSLRVIAASRAPPGASSDATELDRRVDRMLQELGVGRPEEAQLATLYADAVALDILSGSMTAREGTERLHVLHRTGFGLDLSAFDVLFDAYELADDGTYGTAEEVDARVLACARDRVGADP